MDKGLKLLSDLTVFSKYAKYNPKTNKRESFAEIVSRYQNMMIDKFPQLEIEIINNCQYIRDYKVLPSMRMMQFAGKAIEVNNARGYNCSYLLVDSYHAFNETMFLLLGGSGVGYSVQKKHIDKLPEIHKPTKERKFLVQDDIMGWADAVKVLIKSYFGLGSKPKFDFRAIREKGSLLITAGGKAPGAEPLKICLAHIEAILENKQNGEKLTSTECHDIMCHIADSVLSGGIRRAAMIALFDFDDEDMISSKYGTWWEKSPQRGRANNSAVAFRPKLDKQEFLQLWKRIELSNSGEPGIYLTNNPEWGTNPCVTGDTEILTKEGYKEIYTLINQEVEIWNGFEWSLVTPKITGYNQHMLKVTLSDGRELTSTDYHKWILAEGYTGKFKKVETKDLKIGDKIIKYNFPIIKEGEQVSLKHAYTQGFISAEGMDDYKYFWLYEPKYMCKDRLDIKTEGSEFINFNEVKRKTIWYNDVYKEKAYVPFEWNLTSKIEWLSGLFDGDGTELTEGGLQICSTDFVFLKDLQKLLSTLGINCKVLHAQEEGNKMMPDGKGGEKEYFCQKSYRVCIGAVQMQELKNLGLHCSRMTFDKTPQRDASQFVKIVKIEDAGYEDRVYCFNEPLKHLGVFNGILTGQCVEIALRPFQFCNLCEINASSVESEEDFYNRVKVASFLGTLQASFTDFHYLRDVWKKTTEKDALLGIGMTGIASNKVKDYLTEGVKIAIKENERIANIIGIKKAARITCVKPSGTTSCVLGTSSGIHTWHSPYYIRTMRFNKSETVAKYLMENHPEICEDEFYSPKQTLCVRIPIKAPKDSLTRHQETSIEFLERIKYYYNNWVKPGHREGINTHNISATVSIKQDEWETVGEWMWDNKNTYNGLSVLPYDGGSYIQAPFEEITEERYNELYNKLKNIDFLQIIELEDNTTQNSEIACGGGDGCEIK